MDYSAKIKGLLGEISCLKSYCRLNPVLRIVTAILMLPFIVASAALVFMYYVLLFFRNGSSIAVDELEAWLDKRKEGAHFLPEAVLYFLTIPFIFLCKILITLYSGILYFVWFFLEVYAFTATLGGIRFQPCLNVASFDREYVWDFKRTKKTFNVFVFVNLGFIVLCVFQALVNDAGIDAWLMALTLGMIYVVYPQLFAKKNIREMETDEEIYAVATAYAETKYMANYKRASALLKKIPNYADASTLIEEYDSYVDAKKRSRSSVGKIVMIVLAALIVLAVIVPPAVDAVASMIDNSDHLVYIDNGEGTYNVSCDSYSVRNVKIEMTYNRAVVVRIADGAFDGCDKLGKVEIPYTVVQIGNNAFRNCENLETIVYNGTMDQWNAIVKGINWNAGVSDCVVECIDGDITIDSYAY